MEFRLQLLHLLFQLPLQRRVGARVQCFTVHQQTVQFLLFSCELTADLLNAVLSCGLFPIHFTVLPRSHVACPFLARHPAASLLRFPSSVSHHTVMSWSIASLGGPYFN